MTKREFCGPALSPELLAECEELLGYAFQDRRLLNWCLTHASAAKTRLDSNERLEFLGDSVLGLTICEELFRRFPDNSEGELTRIKSVVVSRASCAQLGQRIGLERFLVLGRGISAHGRLPSSVLAAAIESLIGGVYVDGGLEAAKGLVSRFFDADIVSAAMQESGINFKSLLQQLVQRQFGETPTYTVVDERGPDHSKCFLVTASVGEQTFPGAWGSSKKIAEQLAAENALRILEGGEAPHTAE
jgi:ribonuclease-3